MITEYIIISGPPATGKTSLARALSSQLNGVPVISKDAYKEILFDYLEQNSSEKSTTLGQIATRFLRLTLDTFDGHCSRIIIDNNFRRNTDFGAWLKARKAQHIQLKGNPKILLSRFKNRANNDYRHTGHNDLELLPYIAEVLEDGIYDNVDLGVPCLEIDTTELDDNKIVQMLDLIMEFIH